jgi:hypothetical protein
MSKEKVKTVQVSIDTWKLLMQIKLDENIATIDEVVYSMIKDKGY